MIEMDAKLPDRAVEVRRITMRARLHHAAFHRGQDEARQLAPVERARQPGSGRDQASFDGVGPRLEVRGKRPANRWVGLMDLERDAADRAGVDAIGLYNPHPI